MVKMNIAIIFAGGKGIRMGGGLPKQFLEINGKPILIHTVELFQEHNYIDKIYISVLEEYLHKTMNLVKKYCLDKVVKVIPGGMTAQDSIYVGLQSAKQENPGDSVVLIHDGVRPFVSEETITRNIEGVHKHGNAITCTPCFETILLSHTKTTVDSVPYRKDVFSAQAPQSFRLDDIIAAHEQIRKENPTYENMVDACTIMATLGKAVNMIEGNRGNIKVTTPEDVYMFRALIQYKENEQAFGLGLTNGIH